MHVSFFLAAVLGALATNAEDSTTIGYFSPSWDATLLKYGGWTSTAASVAGINAAATTYHVGCLKDAPKTDCDIKHSWTIIQGPATVSLTGAYVASTSGASTSYDITVTQSYECSLKSYTESASCTMSVGASGSAEGATMASSTSSKATYGTGTSSYYELVVTGGVKSLTAPAATKTPDAAAAGPVGALITAAPLAAAAVAALL
ncbi:hypothetical protein BO71DRAFT_402638 [Aspergillus ellipticus CBS 707.79]|uniref:Ig-like domain-containing protein n=1 Tax=Aspergillus ellipticus CBS 707.79 TaxID=1448320 RepID=A0A319CYK3_9EURO|nr:hypothetical protein BO71DRAFT_402638 [Aspergillus ellipticus CBS 707.79]